MYLTFSLILFILLILTITRVGRGEITVGPHPKDRVPTLNWVYYQLIVLGILTQPSSTKQFTSRLKSSLEKGVGRFLCIQLHLHYKYVYLSIYPGYVQPC